MAMDGADSMLEIQLWHIADAVKLTWKKLIYFFWCKNVKNLKKVNFGFFQILFFLNNKKISWKSLLLPAMENTKKFFKTLTLIVLEKYQHSAACLAVF